MSVEEGQSAQGACLIRPGFDAPETFTMQEWQILGILQTSLHFAGVCLPLGEELCTAMQAHMGFDGQARSARSSGGLECP